MVLRSSRKRAAPREPVGGWPLDRVLVGVATLRTIRELFEQERYGLGPPRAWDVALRNGVTPQGAADSLERLHREGFVERIPSRRIGRAHSYRLDRRQPLVPALGRLFATERRTSPWPRMPGRRGPW